MDAQEFTYGFRVAGAPHEPRRLVNWRKAWTAHCAGELDTSEAYLSAWTYGPELVAHMKAFGGVAGFTGPVWADWIPLDIDGAGADPVADALDRTRRLLAWLESQGAELDKVSCWFSGGKGFHVLLPVLGLADAKPGPGFNKAARAFVARIGAATGVGPDLAIYDPVRIFRAPNTRHAKSGLYKVPLRADELLGGISVDAVRRLAAEPRPGDVPQQEIWCDWQIGGMWGEPATEAAAAPVAPVVVDREALNRDTLDFIRRGAANGERERRCFMAAANLAELGADERLASALLQESALDSGLAPNEVRRAIAGGVKHGRGAGS
jgi:hypothetical protein